MQTGKVGISVNVLEKFKPHNEAELAIHAKKIEEVKTWLMAARKHEPANQFLFITGPPGSGKSVCVDTIARELKYDVVEWSTPVDVELFYEDMYDFDSREEKKGRRSQKVLFDDFLYKSSRYCSLFNTEGPTERLLLVNDFPNSMLRKPEEFHDSLEKYRECSITPIVFIATDASRKVLDIAYNLFPAAVMEGFQVHHIKFNAVSVSLLKKAIKRLTSIIRNDKELVKVYQAVPSKPIEENIIASSQGDLRNCCLNFLFTCMKGASNEGIHFWCPDSTKVGNSSATGTDGSGLGLSENLSLMHGLGRIFHPKSVVTDSSEVRFLHTPRSIADCFVTQPTAMLSLLHSNYTVRCSNVQNLSAASENLTLVDVITNEYRSDQLSQIGLDIAVRGIMVHNGKASHGWQQIKKKINLQLLKSDRTYADELYKRGVLTRSVTSKLFATEYMGLVRIIQKELTQKCM